MSSTSKQHPHPLARVLDQLDRCALECDGMTCLISALLSRARIEHTVGVGGILHRPSDRNVAPHLWINLADGWRVDYRARMWLGDRPEVPHGVFWPSDWPQIRHDDPTVPPFGADDPSALALAFSEGIDLSALAEQIRQLEG